MTASARRFAGTLVVLLAGALVPAAWAPALARSRPRPAPCPAARYLVAGEPIRSPVTGVAATGLAIGPRVALDELCAGVPPKRRRANAKGVTRIVARWKSCEGFPGSVALRGRVTSGCARFEGALRANKVKARKIVATRSDCGDAVVDTLGGEVCDDGNDVAGDGCEPTCLPTPSVGPSTPATLPVSTTVRRPTTTTTTVPATTALALVVVTNPSPVLPLGQLTYDVTITNLGPVDGAQVEVRMPIPVGISSCQSISDGGATPDSCFVGRDIVWTIGRLPAGSSRTVQAVLGIGNLGDGAAIVTTARATDAAGSPVATAETTSVVAAAVPLVLGLADIADPVRVGETLEYVVRFGNRGGQAWPSTTLSLTLPAGVTLVDAGGATESPPGTLSWALDTLDGAEMGERRVRVVVTGLGATDRLVRLARAVLASGSIEARATAVTQVEAAPLGLTMVANADPVGSSTAITYQLTATNRGSMVANEVEVRMPIPVGVASCEAISDGGTTPNSCFTGRDVAWTLPALAPQTSRTLEVVFGVGSGSVVPAGTILNATARLTDATGANARAAVSTFVAAADAAPLMVGLAASADPVRVDAALEYVARFGNRGGLARPDTALALTLPAGVALVDAGGATEGPPGTLTWSVGTLDAGQTGERRVRVVVTGLGPDDPLVRVARVVVASGEVAARAAVATKVEPGTLGLVMTAHADPVGPSTVIAYELTVTNRGSVMANELRVRMPIPLGVSSCQAISDGGVPPNSCFTGRDVTWTLPALPARTSRTVQVVFGVGSVAAGTILHGTGHVADASGANAAARVSTAVQPQVTAPLMLALVASADPVRLDDALEYVLRFGNRGALARPDVALTLAVPAGIAVADAGGATAGAGSTLTWNLGTLAAGEVGERRVRVTPTALGTGDPLVRVARAVLASGDVEARAQVVTQVEAGGTLSVAMVAQADPVVPSQVVTYEMTVTNRGNAPAGQAEVRMSIPLGIANCQAISDGGTTPASCIVGRDVAWALGTLLPGSSRAVRVAFGMASAAAAPSGTLLAATARVLDATGANARAGAATAVQAAADAPLMVGLSGGPDPAPIGSAVRYTVRFGNRGAVSLPGTQLTVTLPPGLAPIDTGGGAPGPESTLVWNLGTLDAGETGERVVQAIITGLGAGAPQVRVVRAVLGRGAAAARAGVVTQVAAAMPPLRLSIVAQQDPAPPGGNVAYALTLENTGATPAVQAALRLGIPVDFGACVSFTAGGGAPDSCITGRDIVWSLGTIAPGGSATVQATLRVANTTPPGTVLFAAARAEDTAGARARASTSSAVSAN